MDKYTPRKPQIEKATFDIAEIASLLNVSLPNAYAIAKQPGFPALTVGRRIIVPKTAFFGWLERVAIKD
jgi:excisionase family DNA binding protein